MGVSYLEAVLELFAHKVKDNWIYAGVDSCEVDAEVIQDQEETAEIKSVRLGLIVSRFLVSLTSDHSWHLW